MPTTADMPSSASDPAPGFSNQPVAETTKTSKEDATAHGADEDRKMPATPAPFPESSTPGDASVEEIQKKEAPVQVVDEDRKMPARPSASVQPERSSSTDTVSNTQQPCSGATVSRGFVLNSEGKLQPHEVRMPFAAPANYYAARSVNTQEPPVQGEEDRKPAASLNTSSSPAEVDRSVKTYLHEFQKSTLEERAAMKMQGEQLVKSVEALKVAKKDAYREQILAFETQDVDPLVWKQVLQAQKDTKAQVDGLRDLRSQLVDTLQPTIEALEESKVKATTYEAHEVAYYSSDEDEQQLSTQERQRRRELLKEVVEETMKSGPTLGAGAAAKVAGKVPKIVKATKAAG